MKCNSEVVIPAAFTAAELAEFCKNNGGSKGEHEVYATVENGVVNLCLVKRLTDRRPGEGNGKVWAFRVIPTLTQEG